MRQRRALDRVAPAVVGQRAPASQRAPEARRRGEPARWPRRRRPAPRGPRPTTARSRSGRPARARAWPAPGRPRCPIAMSVCSRIVWPAPLASAVWRSVADQRPLRRRAAVVEDRLADQLDLDLAVEAEDRAHQHVVAVVVGRRARVRRDRVLAAPRAHRERVAHEDPAGRRLPRRQQGVGARLVDARAREVDAERPEPERSGLAVEQGAEHARRVEARDAQPVDRAVGRDQRARVAVRQERVVGDRRERRRRGGALRRGGGRLGGAS